MLIYIKTFFLAKNADESIQSSVEPNVLIKDLYTRTMRFYFEVKKDVGGVSYFIDMENYRDFYETSSFTVNYFIERLDPDSIVSIQKPFKSIKTVRYHDAHRTGYSITPFKIGVNLNTPYPSYAKDDLFIHRPESNTSMFSLYENALVTVNGYVHRTDRDGIFLYAIDGGKTYLVTKDNQLGFLNFGDLGGVKYLDIKPENISGDTFPNGDPQPLKDKMRITFDRDVNGSSAILILGGYMVFPQANAFYQSGPRTFTLIPSNLQLAEKFFESYNYLNLSELGLDLSEQYPDRININELLSDDVLRKYMDLSQTFMVEVNCASLDVSTIAIKKSSYPGSFITYQEPVYPLRVNYGKVAEYWKRPDEGQWSVTVTDSFLKNFVFTEQPHQQLNVFTDARNPTIPYYKSYGVFLKIATYV